MIVPLSVLVILVITKFAWDFLAFFSFRLYFTNIGIIVFSMISWTLENNWSLADHNQMILSRSFTWVINSFVGTFDASGILFGMACLAGLEDENQHVPGEIRAYMGSSFGTIMDSMSYNHPC
jgi:hypothetical protein